MAETLTLQVPQSGNPIIFSGVLCEICRITAGLTETVEGETHYSHSTVKYTTFNIYFPHFPVISITIFICVTCKYNG